MFAQLKTVVAENDDNRIFRQALFFEGAQYQADLIVYK